VRAIHQTRPSPLIYLKLAGKGPTKLVTLQHPDYITRVAFTPDGKSLLAAGGIDGTIYFWDMASRTVAAPIKGQAQGVKCLAISPDGKGLATLSRDGTGKLWDLVSNKQRATVTGENGCMESVAFSPDSKTLAWTSDDRTIKLRNLSPGKEQTIHDHAAQIAFSPDGKTLVSGNWDDKTIKIWDVASGNNTATFTTDSGGGAIARGLVSSLAFSLDGKTLAAGDMAGNVKLWDVTTGKKRSIVLGDGDNPCCVAFSPDGRTLAAGGCFDGKINLWDVKSGKELCTIDSDYDVYSVAFSPDGKTLAVAGTFDKAVILWDVAGVLGRPN